MRTQPIKPTKQNANKMVKVLTAHVDTLLLVMAHAQMEREKCDAIQRRLLGTGSYGGNGDPKLTYLLSDESAARYFADLDAAYREAGYKNLQPGYCPALIAEHEQVQAEWALIEAAEQFFPGMTNNRLLCGTKNLNGLEARQKYLDLLIGLVVNHSSYKPITARR